MKILHCAIALALLSTAAYAQGDNEAKFEKKMNSPFLQKADWMTDYDKALEASTKSGKPILAYFTRSYAN